MYGVVLYTYTVWETLTSKLIWVIPHVHGRYVYAYMTGSEKTGLIAYVSTFNLSP